MKVGKICLFLLINILLAGCKSPRPAVKTNLPLPAADTVTMNTASIARTDPFLASLLAGKSALLDSFLAKKEELRLQVIYTKIDRHKNGRISFTDYHFNTNKNQYFYPASTVKFPVAALALQKLNELRVPGLNSHSTMITHPLNDRLTGVYNDPLSPDGRPTIAQYIKKIFLVSDNDAYNRLYEFLGQEYINQNLHKMGFTKTEIRHRLSLAVAEEENRQTNGLQFFSRAGEMIFEQPAATSQWKFEERNETMGKGFMRGNQLVNEPFALGKKNRLPLEELHGMLKAVYFPETLPAGQQFNLQEEDYAFLRKYMSMTPGESDYPVYNPDSYWPSYVKFLFYGSEKGAPQPGIRIFNKVGDAYGFLTDAAYLVDFDNQVEFMLSATVYCNSDGIFNDDRYDYDTIGFPLLKELGRVMYDYELKRERKLKPDLSTLQFSYKQ